MARGLTFEAFVDRDGLHTYRYVAVDARVFEQSWSGLDDRWPELGPNPYTEFAVNNSDREEMAIYLG